MTPIRPRATVGVRAAFLYCVALAAGVACHNDGISPSTEPPAKIEPVSDLSRSATVGTTVTAGLVVKVSDASGRPVQGAAVGYVVTAGNGKTNPPIATTDANGQATTTWTLGTVAGANEVTATVTGVATAVKFSATGVAGPATSIVLTPQNPRLLAGVDTLRINAQSVDTFGNQASPPPTFTVRDPTLISVDPSGLVHALRRGASTYLVVSAGGKTDSVRVTVLASGQSICTGAADPVELAVGQVITDVPGQGFCVHSSTANAEYALIPYFNSGVPSATVPLEIRGQGVSPVTLAATQPIASATRWTPFGSLPAVNRIPNESFELGLRTRERAEMPSRMPAARQWRAAHRNSTVAAATTTTLPLVGDLVKLNVNAQAFCDSPDYRTGRVMAITDKAIVVADTANPVGGFTPEEYKSIGVTFDTLVDPVDRGAFGDPSDIDNNGHVIMFFTRAVNELTSAGSGSIVLGFFYSRDLLPKVVSSTLSCVGSNVGEMFYLLVPDTAGVVNSNAVSKSQVVSYTNGTVAHEYQHLINASRRIYINKVADSLEDKWLDEGLSHSAEELVFYKAAKRSPRANINASAYSDPLFMASYSTFELNNFRRYTSYLGRPDSQSPIGFDDVDDDLPTRGAIWSYLRYLADHQPASQESAFWYNLVNSNTTGVANLSKVLGTSPYPSLRDWTVSVFMDDNAPNVDARFQQPSWNLRSLLTNDGTSIAFPLATHFLSNNVQNTVTVSGNAGTFYRFSVASGADALLSVTSGGQPLPSTVQLTIVRVR